MSNFSCQCQNYRGNLVVTEKEFYFTSPLFRIELEWSNVKRIRLETQQVKGVPTSVLVVVLQHNEAIRMQDVHNSSQRKRGSASRKYFFHGFQDLLGAEELVKHYLEQYRASERAKEKEGRDETDKDSAATTKRPEKTTEKDDVSSSERDAVKEDSLNLSRLVVSRRPESEPSRAVAPLAISGRRATISSGSRPQIPIKLLSTAPSTAAAGQDSRVVTVLLKCYRYLAVFLVLVMLALLGRYFSRTAAAKDSCHTTPYAEKLLRDIDALAGATAELDAYHNHESLWYYNKGRKRLAELSHVYTQRLEETSVKLMERYVAIQAKLATLRGQRAARIARAAHSGFSAPPTPMTTSSEFMMPWRGGTGVHIASRAQGTTASSSTATADSAATLKDGACAKGGLCEETASQAQAAAAAAQKSKRSTSLSRLRSDIQRWVRRGKAVWAFVSRLSDAARADSSSLQTSSYSSSPSFGKKPSSGERWVVYSEKFGESFQLTEWVAAAESEDRHKCLRLTKDLLDTVELTERVFATFTSVFLVDRYRQLVSGEERGSYWLQPPQALRTVTSRQMYAEKALSGDMMARMAMLRRFVASLVHNQPLVSNQAHRRAAALQVAEALEKYRREEITLLRKRNRGYTDNATMLWGIFNDMVIGPATKPLRDDRSIPDSAALLRNSMEELRFWHAHDSAWREHVLTFFSPEKQADIRSSFGAAVEEDEAERSLMDPSTQSEAMQWLNLPLFRGLLCFEGIPTLQKSEGTIGLKEEEELEARGDREEEGVVEEKEDAVVVASKEEETAVGVADVEGYVGNETENVTSAKPPLRNTTEVESTHVPNVSSPSAPSPSAAAAAEEEEEETPTATAAPTTTPRPAPASAASTLLAESPDLWKEVKRHWLADLETFRIVFDPQFKGRKSRATRSYRLDVEDRSVVANAAEVRRRLFRLLAIVNEHYVHYLTPNCLQRLGNFLRRLLPPYSGSLGGKDVYASALQTWAVQDPAVQLATAQVTGLAPGTTHDVPGSLLRFVLQPPPLLQTSMMSTRRTIVAACVLILFTIVLTVLHFMQ
ncbi:hypothetical protein ABL78_1276 [Leptomonas seymouri]|uniref:Uncharacterized protein n=1 Tax=Leptomonas seymouri TaxID=5684 RepID=A0A0N1IM71_LEPSE|nr:hypothetical protein ABL78_1276 [Leptomonas seymouri]|eukprot:KPI89611.1 hypothetical protein ABL78_1276 [Leptomonas seymouri]